MAVTSAPPRDPRRPGAFGSRLRFLVRFLGLTGALVGCAGVVLIEPKSLQDVQDAVNGALAADPATLHGLGVWLAHVGFLVALLALVVELVGGLRVAAGRRSAVGTGALLQVALAAALLVGVNVWSFQHPTRIDLTRGRQFTLPEEVREQLARLDPAGETRIILYQQHRGLADRPDPFDIEAERKVVEKVKDLIELFREVGPQFRVEVLDVAEKGYSDRLASLTAETPALRQAIESAPESSIFIASGKHVQRVSFSAFYRLDRSASEQRDNLVLRSVGPEPIARRVVNVEERAPRVGILVGHEALSSEGPTDLPYTLAGTRKALLAAGFEVHDVILKSAAGEPSADSLEVTKLERLQNDLEELNAEIGSLQREIRLLGRLVPMLSEGKGTIAELNRLIVAYAEQFNPRFILVRINEGNREIVQRLFTNQLVAARESLSGAQEEQASVTKSLSGLNLDRVNQQRRVKDFRTRLQRAVADFDVLFVPRLTLAQSGDPLVNPAFHDFERRQAEVVRDFLHSGKPVFACLGPTNMPAGGRPGGPPPIKPPDDLERMLAEVGILFGKRTVLFNVEKRAFAGRDENLLRASTPLRMPPLRIGGASASLADRLVQNAFTEVREPLASLGTATGGALFALPFLHPALPPNPVEESLRLADEESGRKLDLQVRFLRPVFINPLYRGRLTYDPEVLATTSATWHDEQPFRTALRPVPRFEPPVPDDPDNGTLEARRRGPFTVGVAVETLLPPQWTEGEKARKVRVAAVGQAGLFTGASLLPGQARLLVDTCNWLVGRREQLAASAPEWSFPRADVSEEAQPLWLWGARLGLPVLFAYLGLIVVLLRRLR